MSDWACSLSEAVRRLGCDPSLQFINLTDYQYTDEELSKLVDCLLAHPNVITRAWLANNHLTDQTGVKLARYLAASSTVEVLDLSSNRIGEATHLALAAALRLNSSLRGLYLFDNEAVDRSRIDTALIDALRLNPNRPVESLWRLYSPEQDEFERLNDAAIVLGHSSLQMLLAQLT